MDYPLNAATLPGRPGKVDCWDKTNANCTLFNDTTPKVCARRKGVGCGQCHYGCVNNSQAEIEGMAEYDSLMRLNIVANSGSHFPTTKRPAAENVNTGWLTPSKMGGGIPILSSLSYCCTIEKCLLISAPCRVICNP